MRVALCVAVLSLMCLSGTAMAASSIVSDIAPGPGEVNWGNVGCLPTFVDFEGMTDGAVLGETIPGLRFTTTLGDDWFVGRWSGGDYYGKYPGEGKPYTSQGDGWAWIGDSAGYGVIEFTGGDAGCFSLLTSTYSELSIAAYDSGHNLLDFAGSAMPNATTGTMTRLTICRPTHDIASVVVYGRGNCWLIDSIATDAPMPHQQDDIPEASSLLLALPGLAGVVAFLNRRAA